MGTKIHCKSHLPGYYSMRDLNEDTSSSSWPLCYGDKAMTNGNGQYYNGFMPRTMIDGYPGYGKDALKQKMLEHEAVFRNQVYELHRLYRVQRDMMDEVNRKAQHGLRESVEPSSSSSHRGSQVRPEDSRKQPVPDISLLNSSYDRTYISGVEVITSPISCTKGYKAHPSQFPFQNGSSFNNSELFDSRPLKARKKLFDLQLPADEYIDTEEREKLPEHKVSDKSCCPPNGNVKSGPGSKLFLGGHAGLRSNSQIAASASASCLRSSIRLADLNEPIEIEEARAPSSIDFLRCSSANGETRGINQSTKPSAGYLRLNEEATCMRDGFSINSSAESNVNERRRFSHLYEAGSSRSNVSSVTHGRQQDKLPIPSHPEQGIPNPVHHPPGIYPTRQSWEDPWRERNHHGLESTDRSRDHSNNNNLEPFVAPQAPGSEPFFNTSHFASSWAHSISSWAKPTSSFSKKITTSDSCLNSAAAMDRGKWRIGASSGLNPDLGGKLTTLNGFYHGSASGSKEVKVHLPSGGFDYLNCSRDDNVASDRPTNNGFGYFPKGAHHADPKPALDINLNEVASKCSSNDVVILQDLNMTDGRSKCEDHLSGLPWLKRKPTHANEAPNTRRSELMGDLRHLHTSSDQFCYRSEAFTDLNQPFTPKEMLSSSDSEMVGKNEIAETQNVKKILGFPIFSGALKTEPSSHLSTLASVACPPEGNNVDKERKNRIIDINLEYEPDEEIAVVEPTAEMEKQMKEGASIRNYIDLNSCLSDSEDPSSPAYESNTVQVKVALDIDLETPIPLENEDDNMPSGENMAVEVSLQTSENKIESSQAEVLRNAAEAMIAISSSCPKIDTENYTLDPLEASLAESLLLFVDAVSSCANEPKGRPGNISTFRDGSPHDFSEEMDDFEVMTLQLQETKEEDYLPTPFVPELEKAEDERANTYQTRSRRGQSRRGRQRRDFQRDILPGLTSLSRHEVTEDIQTFGGLMKATGHHWVGLTRRNGGGRGRRRAVVENVSNAVEIPVCTPLMNQVNSIEAVSEDRSLTGWGKTTRRPRRQRCPSGNNPTAVVLT